MNILVLNGSPHREKSITYKITDSFLKGAHDIADKNTWEDHISEFQIYDLNAEPCRADFSCWFRNTGKCIINDDVARVYEQVMAADVVIWSVPLYVFGFPAPVKNLFDRILPWVRPEIVDDSSGYPSHPGLGDSGSKHILIMSGALPGGKDNFGPAVAEFRRTFGKDSTCITCAESSLLIYRKSKEIMNLADDYLKLARKAGGEFRSCGRIHDDTFRSLNSLMMPKNEYIEFTNHRL